MASLKGHVREALAETLVLGSEMKMKLIRQAIYLSWFTVIYNLAEGAASIGFGVSDESVALAGFGVDSLIEVASATLILWRFRHKAGASRELSIHRERRATLGIGVLFMLLAVVVASVSTIQLRNHSHPETTVPGLVIAALSLSFMFWLWKAKRKVALELDSAAMMKDAACSLACIKLSVVLFAGSLVFLVFTALWWVDSIAAILLAMFIGKEGWETIGAARHPEFSGGCGCSH